MLKVQGNLILAVSLLLVALLTFHAHPAQGREPKELVFGMSAPFTGANGEMGIEFYRGVMAYVDHINAKGGVNGWKIKIIPTNDGYNPIPCFQNTVQFIEEDEVFALFAYVGTPTTTHILPLLHKFQETETFLLFPLSGAQPLRSNPYGKFVYNLRASYFEETAELVDHLVSVGRNRIAVFYQSDAYGRTGWDGVRRSLQRHALKISGAVAYKRGAGFDSDFRSEVALLMQSNPDAIICIGTYASQGALIRDLRDGEYDIPVAGLSFADSDKMLELLKEAGSRAGRSYTMNLINSQIVPSYEKTDLRSVRLYRVLMDNYKDQPTVSDSNYTPRRFSFVSFEGFLNAMLLEEIIRRMGDDPRKERIPEIIESIQDFDLGIGTNITFAQGDHQGLHEVYFTSVIDNRFMPIHSFQRWSK